MTVSDLADDQLKQIHAMLDVIITPHNAQDLLARVQLQLIRFEVQQLLAKKGGGI
jgi:hypothetical protein